MSKVLVSQCPLYFHWEVIVHFKHRKSDVVLVIAAPKPVADQSPGENGDFSHVPGSTFHEIWIPDCAGEKNAAACRQVLVIIHPVHFVVITLESRVELAVFRLPFVVVAQHFKEKVLIHWVVDGLSTHELGTEHVLANRCFLEVPRKKGVHI